jgi:putative transposase
MNLARVSEYVHALITSPFNHTCLGLTEIKACVSHDALNRIVNGDLEFTTVWSSLVSRRIPQGGSLVLDDTILTKYSKGLSCVFKLKDTKTGAFTLAVNVVLLCWTDGTITTPIAFRLYEGKHVGKISLAIELLEFAASLGFTPTHILFDSWYASQGVFDAVHALGAHFVTRLKKNRVLNGKQLRRYRLTPNWSSLGRLRGGTAVAVYRRGSKFYATGDLDLEWPAVKALYHARAVIEEVFRVLKQTCGWEGCQLRSVHGYRQHLAAGVLSWLFLDRVRRSRKTSVYRVRRGHISGRVPVSKADVLEFLTAA